MTRNSVEDNGHDANPNYADQINHLEPLAIGDQRLERKIGWAMGAMINVSYIIGAGIFAGPAFTLQLVGSGGMNLVIWLAGAGIAMAGTWTFAELGTMKAKIFVCVSFYLRCSCPSFVCNNPYGYKYILNQTIPSDVDAGENLSFHGTASTLGPYASALYYVMNSYSGWHNLNFILDEDPIRNLPKASAAALGSTALLYILTNIAYLVVLPMESMKNSQFIVAAAFFTKCFGESFASTVLPVFIGLSAFGCGAAINFSGGRVIMETARNGLLPFGRTFGHVHPLTSSPVNAYLLQYFLAIFFAVVPPPGAVYQFIVAFAAYPVYIFYTLIALSVLILRKREPLNKRPIVAPLVPYVSAIVFMLVCSVFWYYQIIVKDTPGKSYNQSIRNDGRAALEHEVFGGYVPLNNDEDEENSSGEAHGASQASVNTCHL
ncbi:amino acid permease-domain-containing protein [Phycomyces blakesleeanus]|uniref:Amino acid permease-domain-containing protein n=1 Tax=Phycomyces blakesleeanus TaxID=4837 RepID=A0ABR3AT00_PHYBL